MQDTYHIIWRGSFPAMSSTNTDIDRDDVFYGSYVQTYLQRDIRNLAHIGDIHIFLKFLRACAAPLEFKKTANPDFGIDHNFNVLNKLKHKRGTGGVICLISQITPLSKMSNAIPVGLL